MIILYNDKVPKTRTINNIALSGNISLTYDNIGNGTTYKKLISESKQVSCSTSITAIGPYKYYGIGSLDTGKKLVCATPILPAAGSAWLINVAASYGTDTSFTVYANGSCTVTINIIYYVM